MDLVGTMDISELLGVSRQRVQQIVNTKGFPDPVATVNRRTRMWDRAAVLDWVAGQGRYDITRPPHP